MRKAFNQKSRNFYLLDSVVNAHGLLLLNRLSLAASLSLGQQSLLALLGRLTLVLSKQAEQLSSVVLLKREAELVDSRRDL